MTLINYGSFIEKINETKKNNYDCSLLLFYTGDIMDFEVDIELIDEENFYNTFSDLIYYIETDCCNPKEKNNFKRIIDDLIHVSLERKLDKIDVNFILFKEETLKLVSSFKNGKLTEKILEEKLYKLFGIQDNNYLLAQLQSRYKIIR